MAAWIYEGLLLFALTALTTLIFSLITNSRHALHHHHALKIVLLIVIGFYFVWFWSKGQTLAMKTWRIKVTDLDGKPISVRRALLRYIFAWLWFAPPLIALTFLTLTHLVLYATFGIWLLFYLGLTWKHPSQQFLHDRLAGTRLLIAT